MGSVTEKIVFYEFRTEMEFMGAIASSVGKRRCFLLIRLGGTDVAGSAGLIAYGIFVPVLIRF
jgi:hypothetical protein